MEDNHLFERLLTPSEVARCFNVDPKTVSRWARDKIIPSTKTPGGHRRFRASDVRAFLEEPDTVAANETAPTSKAGDARA